jgi:hypothetical protein
VNECLLGKKKSGVALKFGQNVIIQIVERKRVQMKKVKTKKPMLEVNSELYPISAIHYYEDGELCYISVFNHNEKIFWADDNPNLLNRIVYVN